MKDAEVRGDVPSGGLDSATSAPVKVGGVARTVNPAAVLDSQRVQSSFDDLGRQVITPYQVRDLVSTAQAILTRVAETTVLAGVASTFLDIVSITGANTSTNALRVDIRSGTGGTVVESIVVPAGGSVTRDYLVPLPQSEVAQAWTGQVNVGGEVSDNPVSLTILALRNV